MQAVNDEHAFFGVELLVFTLHVGQGLVEPLLEVLDAVEDGGEEKVEQGPQLRKVVLQRGPRQQKAVARFVNIPEGLRELAL